MRVFASGQTTPSRQSVASLRRDRISRAIVTDPDALADYLSRLQSAIDAVTLAQRQDPRATAVVFLDRAITGAGALVRFRHDLNRRVFWRAIDWTSSSTSALSLRRDASTTLNELVLISQSTGTVSIEVY